MVVLEVYTKAIKVKYKTNLFSKATLFYTITTVIAIVVPYILAYESGGFWNKWDVVYEQPKINIRGDFLIILMTNNLNSPIICSTFNYYKNNLHQLNSCTLFLLKELDENYDGKPDKLDFNVKINLHGNKATSLFIFLPINYTLTTVCPLQMQSAIIFQYHIPEREVNDFLIMGDLGLRQSSITFCYKHYFNDSYDFPVIDNDIWKSGYYEPDAIWARYLERNLSTHLINSYLNIKQEYLQPDVFNLKLMVNYPEHKIIFKPGFWQILKFAWMQYFSILIIVGWVIDKLRNYIFKNRLLLFYEDSPLSRNAFTSKHSD